jgi:hypothetical protein
MSERERERERKNERKNERKREREREREMRESEISILTEHTNRPPPHQECLRTRRTVMERRKTGHSTNEAEWLQRAQGRDPQGVHTQLELLEEQLLLFRDGGEGSRGHGKQRNNRGNGAESVLLLLPTNSLAVVTYPVSGGLEKEKKGVKKKSVIKRFRTQ